ncbi:hypothetical protein HAX54_000244, partial [Datura stramonium]|nr:hypothetical protein [Datura stramonium]
WVLTDETLVSAYDIKFAQYHGFRNAKANSKINYVTVFERPRLHEVSKRTHEFADLVLFTAGLEGYARPLVDKIDVGNRADMLDTNLVSKMRYSNA